MPTISFVVFRPSGATLQQPSDFAIAMCESSSPLDVMNPVGAHGATRRIIARVFVLKQVNAKVPGAIMDFAFALSLRQ